MCTWLDTFLRRVAKWYIIIPLLVLQAAFGVAFRWRNQLIGVDAAPDGQIFYTPQELASFFATIRQDGRAYYAASELTLDVLYPLIYGTTLGWLLVVIYRTEYARVLLLVPLFVVAFDLAENVTLACLALTYDGGPTKWALAAAGYTMTKWFLLIAYMPIIFAGAVLRLARAAFGRWVDAPPEA